MPPQPITSDDMCGEDKLLHGNLVVVPRSGSDLINLWVPKDFTNRPQIMQALLSPSSGLMAFRKVLHFLAHRVFQMVLVKYSLSVYWEESNTIAFNRGGKLFFNSYFFRRVNQHPNRLDYICYWFPVFAHELAHNVSTGHGIQHGNATETIIQEHLGMLLKCAKGLLT